MALEQPGSASGGGMLTFTPASQVLEGEARAMAEGAEPKRVMLELANHVRSAFAAAYNHRRLSGVTDEIQDCKRRWKGQYDDARRREIEEQGGSVIFFKITGQKCATIRNYVNDKLGPAKERSWGLDPTPIPDLPESVHQDVARRVVAAYLAELELGGQPWTVEAIQEQTRKAYDARLKELSKAARQRADRMADKIMDQLVEGGYIQAFSEFVSYLSYLPTAFLKGPVVRMVKREKWVGERLTVVEEPIPTFSAPNPEDIYPGPNQANIGQGYVCETIVMDKGDLEAMKGQPGWNADEIDAVLASERTPVTCESYLGGEQERATLENRDLSVNQGLPDVSVMAVEYRGSASGRMLEQWGMKGVNPAKYYQIEGILVGNHMVRAILNPDPLGRRPYKATSIIKVPGSIWGIGLPKAMDDVQDITNPCVRHMVNNLAITSGPMVGLDLDAKEANEDGAIIPWKVWGFHGRQATPGIDPIYFFQPQNNVEALLRVAEWAEGKADDRTGATRFMQGSGDAGQAGSTYGGLAILESKADKGINQIVIDIDIDVVRQLIEHQNSWNNHNLPDEEFGELKGDCRVVARGAIAQMLRSQEQVMQQEFLKTTNNPTDQAIIGQRRRANLLRAVASGINLPEDDIVPPDEEIENWTQQSQAAALGIQSPPQPGMAPGARALAVPQVPAPQAAPAGAPNPTAAMEQDGAVR